MGPLSWTGINPNDLLAGEGSLLLGHMMVKTRDRLEVVREDLPSTRLGLIENFIIDLLLLTVTPREDVSLLLDENLILDEEFFIGPYGSLGYLLGLDPRHYATPRELGEIAVSMYEILVDHSVSYIDALSILSEIEVIDIAMRINETPRLLGLIRGGSHELVQEVNELLILEGYEPSPHQGYLLIHESLPPIWKRLYPRLTIILAKLNGVLFDVVDPRMQALKELYVSYSEADIDDIYKAQTSLKRFLMGGYNTFLIASAMKHLLFAEGEDIARNLYLAGHLLSKGYSEVMRNLGGNMIIMAGGERRVVLDLKE